MEEFKTLVENAADFAGNIFNSVLDPLLSYAVEKSPIAALLIAFAAIIGKLLAKKVEGDIDRHISDCADRFNDTSDPNRSGKFTITPQDIAGKQKLKNGIFKIKTIADSNGKTFNADRQIVSGRLRIYFYIVNTTKSRKKVKIESKIYKEGKRFHIAVTKPVYYNIETCGNVFLTNDPCPFDSEMNEFSKLPAGRYFIKIIANGKEIYSVDIIKE